MIFASMKQFSTRGFENTFKRTEKSGRFSRSVCTKTYIQTQTP